MMCSLLFGLLFISFVSGAPAVLGIGDSISVALNSMIYNLSTNQESLPFPVAVMDPVCATAVPSRVWGAMIDNTYQGIDSYAEKVNAPIASNIASGPTASMLTSFFVQSSTVMQYWRSNLRQTQTRVIVLLGHGDMCSSQTQKNVPACSSPDQDPNNYCRTTVNAYEREFRKGMDQLITMNQTEIVVFAPFRYSQICNFRNGQTAPSVYGPARPCNQFWTDAGTNSINLGFGPCSSLTSDCSSTRMRDAYEIQAAYLAVMKKVVNELQIFQAGATTSSGGEMGHNVTIVLNEDPWKYQFQAGDISACDCFSFSRGMQQKFASFATNGLVCSSETPCCSADNPHLCSNNDGTTPSSGHAIRPIFVFVLFLLMTIIF